jgi:esterase/lipase superfamily enzyme
LIDDREEFLSYLRADVQKSPQKHALVFIHGYNVTFELAAMRTAQLAHDLDFDGPAAFFSWPSNGTTIGYVSDGETVELSAPQLKEFLTDIIKDTGAQSVHVIAHSMGNRALTEMLIDLERARNDEGLPVLNQVVMAAPDVNATKFRNNIVDRIKDAARNFTLYASSRDIALLGSEILRQSDYTRLGQGGDDRQVFPDIETIQTIDASELPGQALFLLELGHSYYVDPNVMQDLKYLLETPTPARQRAWLKELPHRPEGSYWIFDATD